MKNTVFTGAGVAIITPMRDGKIDHEAYAKLIEWQIASHTDAIIACGTTGESSTLSDEEHIEAIEFAVKQAAGRVPVIAGTGSNDTEYAVWLSKEACRVGADALLVVTPYYNKASAKGLIRHFTAIADASTKPIILYNVPSRTGCNITLPVYRELAKHPNIVAVKEASGNISAIAQIIAELGDQLDVYSGNDDQIVPILSLGGKGVISVLSNVMPREAHDICELYFSGRVKESAELQLRLLDLINALFIEVNPVPVKAAMNLMGYCTKEIRSPMCEPEEEHLEVLRACMIKHGLLPTD